MSIISLKSSSSSDEISMKLDHSFFINEFKHSLTLTKSFSSLSIINLTSSSSSFHSSKSRASSNSLSSKIITFVTVVLTVSSSLSLSFLDESMNLSFVIVIVQDKTLIVSEIKKICNK